jgi:hypothetical protein
MSPSESAVSSVNTKYYDASTRRIAINYRELVSLEYLGLISALIILNWNYEAHPGRRDQRRHN